MNPRFPSASRIGLAKHCVYPWASGASWPSKGPRTPAQRYGDAFHKVADDVGSAGGELMGELAEVDLDARVGEAAEKFSLTPAETTTLRASAVYVRDALEDDHVRGPRHVEAAAAFDPYSGARRFLAAVDRALPGEMYARVDLAFWRSDGPLVVRDWKTGERTKGAAPRDTPQLRALALAFYQPDPDGPGVRVEIAHVGEEGIDIVGDDLTIEDLRQTEAELVEIADRIAQPPRPEPGPWCERMYCPMQATCPATLAALATIDADITTWPLRGAIVSQEQAVFLRTRLPVLQEWIAERERAVEEEAKRSPLPVPGKEGVFWGPVEFPGREKVAVTEEALETVRLELPLGADVAIEQSMSKASIERGIRKQVLQVHGGTKMPRGAAKPLTDKIFGLLREEKALKRGPKYVRFMEFRKLGDGVIPLDGEEGDANG